MSTATKKDDKPVIAVPKRKPSVETKSEGVSGFDAFVARYRHGEVQQLPSYFRGPQSFSPKPNGGRRKSSCGGRALANARKGKPSTTGDPNAMTDEERELLKQATFERADLNRDLVLEATEIKLAYESVGIEITDVEIWQRMAECHEAYKQAMGSAPSSPATLAVPVVAVSRTGSAVSQDDRLVVTFEQFLAYPQLLPEAYSLATFHMYVNDSAPSTPVSKKREKENKEKRRGSGFSYISQNPERKPLRHAILIALDRYADERIPPTTHCINDVRSLGEVLEALDYSVEILVNDMDHGCQPTRSTILDALSCSRDRGADMLLVFFAGYWVSAHLADGVQSKRPTQFCICYDTTLEFTRKNVLTLDDIKKAAAGPEHGSDTVLLVDGLQPAFIPGCRGEGYSVVSYMGEDTVSSSQLRHKSLLSYYLTKGMLGAAQDESGAAITAASLHRYLGQKLSKQTYAALPNIPNGADQLVLCNTILQIRNSETHPRPQQKALPVRFLLDCAFPAATPPEEFADRAGEVIRGLEILKGVQVAAVTPCTCAEFLLHCTLQDIQPLLPKFKSEVEKLADENTWVRMRTGAADAPGSSLSWTLTASFGLDFVSPAILLTIHTASDESVGKLRARYLNRHLKEWCGLPILWMRQRVLVTLTGSEYERLKMDVRWRVGAFTGGKDKSELERGKPPPAPAVFFYAVKKLSETVWSPQSLPLRKFNRLSEAQFEKLYDGLPMVVQWCGKLEEPNVTATQGQERTHKALREVCTEATFKNKLHFFQYEVDSVVYPPHILDGLSKYNSRRSEDEVTIIYLKYDRAFTLELNSANVRISAEKIREFCNDFLQGKAKRLNDGTMKALRPPGMPEDHPGTVVVGINHFDRLVMDVEKDVLVLYWNVSCPGHNLEKLERAVKAMTKLGQLFSEQPEEVHLPSLVVMSDDNREAFFFPEHHPEGKMHIPTPVNPDAARTVRSPVAGRRSTEPPRAASPPSPAPTGNGIDVPPFTIRLFPANESAAWRRRRGEFLDYWPEVFETTVRTCKTFFAAASGPAPLCAFLERSTDWAPRVPLRIAIDETAKAQQEQQEKLPDIFKGL